MTPVKKSKARQARRDEIEDLMDPRTQKKFQRDADNALIDLEERIEERWDFAQKTLKIQNEAVRLIVRELVENMKRMAGDPKFTYNGALIPGDMDKMRALQERNFTWIAVRLLAACAIWDIQISGFILPDDSCAKCGVGISTPKKKRRK